MSRYTVVDLIEQQLAILREIREALSDNAVLIIPEIKTQDWQQGNPDKSIDADGTVGDGYDEPLHANKCMVDSQEVVDFDEVAGIDWDITHIPTEEEAMECIDAEFGDYAPKIKPAKDPDIFGLGWWLEYRPQSEEWQLCSPALTSVTLYSSDSRFVALWHKAVELLEQHTMMMRRWQEAEGRADAACQCDGGCDHAK